MILDKEPMSGKSTMKTELSKNGGLKEELLLVKFFMDGFMSLWLTGNEDWNNYSLLPREVNQAEKQR